MSDLDQRIEAMYRADVRGASRQALGLGADADRTIWLGQVMLNYKY